MPFVAEVEEGLLRRRAIRYPKPAATMRRAMQAITVLAMMPGDRVFDVEADGFEFELLFAYVGDRIALICSAAPSCQTH
jgi:hypothetical protein